MYRLNYNKQTEYSSNYKINTKFTWLQLTRTEKKRIANSWIKHFWKITFIFILKIVKGTGQFYVTIILTIL